VAQDDRIDRLSEIVGSLFQGFDDDSSDCDLDRKVNGRWGVG
jgi:hypothetical protein